MLHPFGHPVVHVVGSCCTKLEMVQSLKPTSRNISFVP